MDKEALFTVPVADLDYGERELEEEIPASWLEAALAGTEATPRGSPGRLEVTLMKSGRDVMIRGRAQASVTMPCARTLDPVDVNLDADIFLLLGPPTGTAVGPGARRDRKGRAPAEKREAASPKARPKAPRTGSEGKKPRPDDALGTEDAARDAYVGDRIVLDGFVREFLLLELPMFPLREDLRSETTPAIDGPESGPSERAEPAQKTLDPRLAPLAALKNRLREKKE